MTDLPPQYASALEDRIADVRYRIERACRRSDRDPNEITLIAVSKLFPIEAVRAAAALGLADFGESRPQELKLKEEILPGQLHGGSIRWHMIGSVQRNKARMVVDHADLLHSLDSERLARALSDRISGDRTLECLVQVNVSAEHAKSGFSIDETEDAVGRLAEVPGIRICGLMGMAEYFDDPELARPQFRLLRELANAVRTRQYPDVEMRHLSMGMSNDYEVAIEEGATLVRVGTAVFGGRPGA